MRLRFFFFNDTATTEIYTLSLHDALPICRCGARSAASARTTATRTGRAARSAAPPRPPGRGGRGAARRVRAAPRRSEEHTSELQARQYLVCRLLLEKKKKLDEDDILVVRR